MTRAWLTLAVAALTLAFGVAGAQAAFPGANGRIALGVAKWRSPAPETCTPDPHSCYGPVLVSSAIESVLPSGRGRRVLFPWTVEGVADESAPAWSPNGRLLALQLALGRLAIIHRDGTGFRRLPQLKAWASEPTWSPDGRRLAFAGERQCPLYCRWLYTVRPDGTGLRRVIAQGTYSPAWSVTGRIAFVNWDDLPTRRIGVGDGLYTVKPDGSGLRRLYSGGYLGPGITPDWSPHGSRIVFAAATTQAPDNQEIFTVKANGTGLRQLTSFKSHDSGGAPVWSPDGRYIAFLRTGGLYVMRPNGRGMRRIVAARLQDPDNPQRIWTDLRAPSWQPLPRDRP
jgi:Tol biopolymer transport system component